MLQFGLQVLQPQQVTRSTSGTHRATSGVPPARHRRRRQNVPEAEAGEAAEVQQLQQVTLSAEDGPPVPSSRRVTTSTWEIHCNWPGSRSARGRHSGLERARQALQVRLFVVVGRVTGTLINTQLQLGGCGLARAPTASAVFFPWPGRAAAVANR